MAGLVVLCALLFVSCFGAFAPHQHRGRNCVGTRRLSGLVMGQTTSTTQVAVYGRNGHILSDWSSVTAQSDGTGTFNVSYEDAPGVVFVVVRRESNNQRLLVSVLHKTRPTFIVVNDFTTVAAAYGMAQFLVEDNVRGANVTGEFIGTRNAGMVSGAVVDTITGSPSKAVLESDKLNITTLAKLKLLASVVRACDAQYIADPLCRQFIQATARRNAFFAMTRLATSPALVVPGQDEPDWTLPILLTNSGDPTYTFDSPAAFAFDYEGNVYVTNNDQAGSYAAGTCKNANNQTSACPGRYILILGPDGAPLSNSPFFGTPDSIIGSGFGASINWANNDLWIGSFQDLSAAAFLGRGDPNQGFFTHFSSPNSGLGFINKFDNHGAPTYIAGVQGINSDRQGNVYVASLTSNRVCRVSAASNWQNVTCVANDFLRNPFDVDTDSQGYAWVSDANAYPVASGGPGENKSYAVKLDGNLNVVVAGELPAAHPRYAIRAPSAKAIVVDSHDNAWVSVWLADAVSCFLPNGLPCPGSPYSVPDCGPWGISLDGRDNIYLACFGDPLTLFQGHSIVVLCGASSPECKMGDIISTQKGWGSRSKALMRLTDVQTSSSGAVWTCNNYVPQPTTWLNPGGNGVVMFPGLAVPPKKKILG